MTERCFQMYLMPSVAQDGTYVIVGSIFFRDEGKVGMTYDLFRSAVDVDTEWLDAAPDDQFAYIAVELISQVIAKDAPTEVLASMRKAIAQVVEEAEIL